MYRRKQVHDTLRRVDLTKLDSVLFRAKFDGQRNHRNVKLLCSAPTL